MAQPTSGRRSNGSSSSRIQRASSSSRPPASGHRHGHTSNAATGSNRTNLSSPRTVEPYGSSSGHHRSSSRSSRQGSGSGSANGSSVRRARSSGEHRHAHTSYQVRQTHRHMDSSSDLGSEASSQGYRRSHPEICNSSSEPKYPSSSRKQTIRSQYSGDESPVFKRTSVQSEISQNSKAARKVIDGNH